VFSCNLTVRAAFLVASFTLLGSVVRAETGVTASTILIGQSAPFSGPNGQAGKQYRDGALAYFQKINRAGGIFGRKIQLTSLDDGYEAANTVANTARLIDEKGVFALFGYYGSAAIAASAKVFSAAQVPLIAGLSGADGLRTPLNRYLFNVRASYSDEAEAIVNQLVTTGATRIAVFYQDDAYGQAGLQVVTAALAQRKLSMVASGAVPRNSVDASAAAASIAKAAPQAVVLVALYKPAAAFIKEMNRSGAKTTFIGFSPVSADLLYGELGEASHGVMVAQVMPSPVQKKTRLSTEYINAMAESALDERSYYGIEGYAAAKVLVEGLRRAGKNLTRPQLINALETMNDFDLGGLVVAYSAKDHRGSKFVTVSLISAKGKVIE
jgi:branched-chain amino acid transport system substrate-binding protein